LEKVDWGIAIGSASFVASLMFHIIGTRRTARKDALEELRAEFEELKGQLGLCRETNRQLTAEKTELTRRLLKMNGSSSE
jgi:hypothetical protein